MDLKGLTGKEAHERALNGQSNVRQADPGKTPAQIFAGNFFTFFNLINLILAIALLLVGSYRNMLFLGTVLSNALIGTVQELRARATINRLQLLNRADSTVIRDGKEIKLSPDALVLGDLIVLKQGEQVPADAVIRSGSGAADESLLTGESDRVAKKNGDELLSGSYITEGCLYAELTRVGDSSFAAKLTREAKAIKQPRSRLMTDLDRLLHLISALLLPMGVLLLGRQVLLNQLTIRQAVPGIVASMIGMIPEGLILLTSVALFVGVIRLGRRNVLVQEMNGIEMLARADVLCLDKTGTLTTGRMHVHSLLPLGVTEAEAVSELRRLLGAMEQTGGTFKALCEAYPPVSVVAKAVLPFSSANKKSAASFDDGKTLLLGAPGFVMHALPDGIAERVRQAASTGLRVLLLARADGCIMNETAPQATEPLALLMLQDELREGCAETLEAFRREQVDIKIISGDDPATVAAIASRLGLDGCDRMLDASRLKAPEEIRQYAENTTVFGRVSPTQKRMLVEALKASGHCVAMTGDGVNDIPALKAADCSIAVMGGADATRHTALIVIPDDGFPTLPQVVLEGRRVVGNITRAASLFLIKTLSTLLITLLVLFLPLSYPFQPIQLTLISTLTVGLPSFLLTLQPNRERISGDFMTTVISCALPGALGLTVSSLLCMTFVFSGVSLQLCSASAAICALAVSLISLARVCMPLNKLRGAVLLLMTSAAILLLALIGPLFFIDHTMFTPLSWSRIPLCLIPGLMAMLAFSIVPLPVGQLVRQLLHQGVRHLKDRKRTAHN